MALKTPDSLTFACVFLVCVFIGFILRHLRRQRFLPPSPPADPILGHVRYIPRKYPWITFAGWGSQLGGILYLHLFGKPMIVLNDLKIARDLLDKRSSNYSDRPRFIFLSEMMGWGDVLSLLRYGDKFRMQRRMFQRHFNSQAVQRFRPIQNAEMYTMLNNIVEAPEKLSEHIDRATAGTVTMATYSYPIVTDLDPFIVLMDKISYFTVKYSSSIVDFLPALRYIPSWMSGAEFKRDALNAKLLVKEMFNMPFNYVKEAGESISPCLTSYMLDERRSASVPDDESEEIVKAVSGQIFGAAFETSRSIIHTFLCAMLHHPDVVRRAQVDIDREISQDRMPTLEDKDSLPYITDILKECMRWCPPAPLGMPHVSIAPDEYCGLYIPAGSVVVANIWQFMHDERFYLEPEKFYPGRYSQMAHKGLNEVDYDPLNVVFGFGRRICPGRLFAEQGSWLTMACILAAFDIKPPLDSEGCEYTPEIAFTSGLSSEAANFKCRLVPRSESYVKLIRRGKANAE